MNKLATLLFTLLIIATSAFAQVKHPRVWSQNAVVYEVNVRQFSEKGDLNTVTQNLKRLKRLGVDVLWMMPLHPIGEINRKGGLGSYYSVKDYKAIDASYGTNDDFKVLVRTAHDLGMKVIIDWVANHTAWDHEWIQQHPDWYVKNERGEIQTQYDWTDVAKLNYENPELCNAMSDEMRYWINQFNIDGFRCDVAFLVPQNFWESNRSKLEEIKPLFMLAEMEWNTDITPTPNSYFERAFDASYGWNFMGVTQDMAKKKKTLNDFRTEMNENYEKFPRKMLKLFFITNHDENSWNGTVTEKYGDDWKLYSALCYTLPQSLPLIYTGEEAGLNRRLQFFEKDPLTENEWKDTSRYEWYKSLTDLKHRNKAIWNSTEATFRELTWNTGDTSVTQNVYAFTRKNGNAEVTVVINFGDSPYTLKPTNWTYSGGATISTKKVTVDSKNTLTIPPHSVWINHKN